MLPNTLPNRRLQSLQVLRGLAALYVLLFHLGLFSSQLTKTTFLHNVFQHGGLGVSCFFVLSGFIIYYIHGRDIGQPGKSRAYFMRRLIRVYPLLFLATLTKVAYVFTIGRGIPDDAKSPSVIISSFLMVPIPNRFPLISVAWTLSHEMLFYVFFLFLIILYRRCALPLIVFWLSCCVFMSFSRDISITPPLNFLFSPYNLQFILGVACAWCIQRTRHMQLLTLALPSSLCLAAVGLYYFYPLEAIGGAISKAYWGVTFFLMTLGAVSLESVAPIRFPNFLVFLGDASYSIYLFHTSFLHLMFLSYGYCYPASTSISQLTLAAFGIGSLLATLGAYILVERPMQTRLRSWLKRQEHTTSTI